MCLSSRLTAWHRSQHVNKINLHKCTIITLLVFMEIHNIKWTLCFHLVLSAWQCSLSFQVNNKLHQCFLCAQVSVSGWCSSAVRPGWTSDCAYKETNPSSLACRCWDDPHPPQWDPQCPDLQTNQTRLKVRTEGIRLRSQYILKI